jgi:hypothetical protein
MKKKIVVERCEDCPKTCYNAPRTCPLPDDREDELREALESIIDRCNTWAKGPAHDVRHDVALIARRVLGKEP